MSNKMQEIQMERGKPLKQIIQELWDKHESQVGIAEELGVNQSTVSYWMLKLGMSIKTTRALVIDERETA